MYTNVCIYIKYLHKHAHTHTADILISYLVEIVVKLKMVGHLLSFVLKVTVIILIIKEKIRRAKHNNLIKFLQKIKVFISRETNIEVTFSSLGHEK